MTRRTAMSLLSSTIALAQDSHPLTNDDRASHQITGHAMPMALPQIEEQAMPLAVGLVKPVLTRSGDNLRSNVYQDPALCARLLAGTVAKKLTITVPGDLRLEAQPLVVPSVTTSSGEVRDLILFAGMGGQVSAFDANSGTPIWLTFLGSPIIGSSKIDAWQINPSWSCLSTGVVIGNMLYVVAWTSRDGTVANSYHRLHGLNLRDGSQPRQPLVLTRVGAMARKQRGSLLASGNSLFIPWGTVAETAPGAHGYITKVDTQSWSIVTELQTTHAGSGAGLWNAGQGPVFDGTYLYTSTGNGSYNGTTDFGECVIKLTQDLVVVDHWHAFDDSARGAAFVDQDLGSSQVLLCQDKGFLVAVGKDGVAYVLDINNLSKGPVAPPIFITFNGLGLTATNLADLNVLHNGKTYHQHASLLYFNGLVWCFGENSNLRAFSLSNAGVLSFVARSGETASIYAPGGSGMPGGFSCVVQGAGSTASIVASIPDGDANRSVTTGRLFAFNASPGSWTQHNPDGDLQIARTWMSNEPPAGHGSFNKFMVPLSAGNGMLYYGRYDGTCPGWG